MYSIGAFARVAQVSVTTLRHYDAIGLLRPARVERTTGYRYYAVADLERLHRILVFRDLGFALDEIRRLVADVLSVTDVLGLLRERVQALEEGVARDAARLDRARARLGLLESTPADRVRAVAVRVVDWRLVASVRDRLRTHDECERLFDELHHHTGGRYRRQQPGAVWHVCAADVIECEAFVCVPAGAEARGRVRLRELPAEAVASLVYRDDAGYPDAYRAVRAWLHATSATTSGPKRELYFGGDDAESMTEVQFPIAAEVRA